jgi:type II secretory pathway pseudopilin PulG
LGKNLETNLDKGLSLIEVLLVLALAMVLGSAIIPRVLGTRIALNEATAITNLRIISSAQETYSSTYPKIGYADRLDRLAFDCSKQTCKPTPEHACLIECMFVKPGIAKDGYFYSLSLAEGDTQVPRTHYVVATAPAAVHRDGERSFCAMEDGKVRYAAGDRKPVASVTWSGCRALSFLP